MQNRVKKREVFYLHGYDPRGARKYHSLYKEHLLKQNNINQINASVSKREFKDAYSSWDIKAYEDGIQTDTKYTFLSWADIIAQNWSKNIYDILFNLVYNFYAYVLSGVLFKVSKLAPYIFFIAFYTTLYTVFLFSFSAYLGYLVSFCFLEFIPIYISSFIALGVLYLSLRGGMFIGKKVAVFWLFDIYTFTAMWARGNLKGIDSKIDSFVDKIYATLEDSTKSDIDEVLIVAHSVGSMLSVPILTRLIKRCKEKNIDTRKVKLLTLGGDIPLISLHKQFVAYREDLQYLAREENFVWVDYSSKIDGTCFPMVDPILSAGMLREEGKGPVLLSSKFYKLFTKKRYKKIRYKWFDVHFLYLMSHEIAGEYDYFKMTAGSKPLESRIQGK